jgi:hypothetical protein
LFSKCCANVRWRALFKTFGKQEFDDFVRAKRWAIVSNLEERSKWPRNVVELQRFVNAFDDEMTRLNKKENWLDRGLNFEEFVESFEFKVVRPFQNTSAVAAVLHYSNHLLHLVAFADGALKVHLWFVPDSVPSVFDFLVMLQEESKELQGPSVAASQFLQKCIEVGIAAQKGETGPWLARRVVIISGALNKGQAEAGSDFSRSLGQAFLLFCRQFEAGREQAVTEFVNAYLVRRQDGAGRPSVLSRHPQFLVALEETVEQLSGIVADARVTRGVSYQSHGSNAGARHYAARLMTHYGIFLSQSAILTYLWPVELLNGTRNSRFKFAQCTIRKQPRSCTSMRIIAAPPSRLCLCLRSSQICGERHCAFQSTQRRM